MKTSINAAISVFVCCAMIAITPLTAFVAFSGGDVVVNSRGSRSSSSNPTSFAVSMKTATPSTPIPKSIKESTSQLTQAVQKGLQSRLSRMEVQMPMGARFGVEKDEGDDGFKNGGGTLAASNRELARLFVEMFSPIGEAVTVVFPSEAEAQAAEKKWGKDSFPGKVTSMYPPKKGKDKKVNTRRGGGGFAQKLEALTTSSPKDGSGSKVVPRGTEVLVVVAPSAQELSVLERELDSLGMGCCVILLNSRLDVLPNERQRKYYLETFEPIFFLQPVGTGETEDFLFKAYPKDWTIARKPKIGPPKVLKVSGERWTAEDVQSILEENKVDGGILSNLF